MLNWIFLIYIKKKQTIFTCLLKTAISSLNDSDEHTSPPAIPGSLGVLVANSHFSNINASRGNSGCLEKNCLKKKLVIFQSTFFFLGFLIVSSCYHTNLIKKHKHCVTKKNQRTKFSKISN